MPTGDQTFWDAFNDQSVYIAPQVPSVSNVALDVLTKFGISCSTPSIGGDLKNIDLKRVDATTAIKMSLLEYSANAGAGIYEPVVDYAQNAIAFKKVGSYSGNISDVYYTMQSETILEECAGVLLHGGRPLPERVATEWKPIWGNSKEIYDFSFVYEMCCKAKDFNTMATIIFNDPHLDTHYEDGIANFYEIDRKQNPYHELLGYAYQMVPPVDGGGNSLLKDDTIIEMVKTCQIPIEIGSNGLVGSGPNMGTLVTRPLFNRNDNELCWADQGELADFNKGLRIELPTNRRFETVRNTTVDKFIGISGVYLIGRRLKGLGSIPKDAASTLKNRDTRTTVNQVLGVSIDTPVIGVYKLNDGEHYTIAYATEDGVKIPYVVFCKDVRPDDVNTYGSEVEFNIREQCEYHRITGLDKGRGTIFPINQAEGVWVYQIFVEVTLDTHAIVIKDPSGNATQIAEGLQYNLKPLIINREEPPIAYNGQLIDPLVGRIDSDPTQQQDLEDTPIERAFDEMAQGGVGFNTTLCFIMDGPQLASLSKQLYDYMNKGEIIETTYICGPNCHPLIGGSGRAGGVINNITHSYTDSGSYTVSINEGPYLVSEFASFDGSIDIKQAEGFTAQGTIIQDLGNHIHYKVRVDGLGDRNAINQCSDILREGDRVSVAVHNNPIEQ